MKTTQTAAELLLFEEFQHGSFNLELWPWPAKSLDLWRWTSLPNSTNIGLVVLEKSQRAYWTNQQTRAIAIAPGGDNKYVTNMLHLALGSGWTTKGEDGFAESSRLSLQTVQGVYEARAYRAVRRQGNCTGHGRGVWTCVSTETAVSSRWPYNHGLSYNAQHPSSGRWKRCLATDAQLVYIRRSRSLLRA